MANTKDNSIEVSAKSTKPTIPPVAPHHLLPPKEEENILRRSLKEIGEDMKKMEDLITLTEDIIRRERERDREFYLRERRRKLSENPSIPRHLFQIQKIEPKELHQHQTIEIASNKSSSPKKEIKSPLTFRKKITKRFKRKSMKSDKRKPLNNQEESMPNQPLKSPTLKISMAGKPNRKVIRFSPRRYRSRLYFRNGKIGCIDAENVSANQTNIEKTHAIVNYITSDLDNYTCSSVKRSSITSNISDILSEESTESLDDLPNSNSYFNFDYSATDFSDDRGIADDDFYVNSLSDIDSFTVQPKSDEELTVCQEQNGEIIEDTIQQQTHDAEIGNNDATPKMPASTSDATMVDFIDEITSKQFGECEEKAPNSAMSNHSNIT